MTLPGAITDILPPDDQVRVGTVTQTAPLIVNVQGGDVVSPGVLFGANFFPGDVVTLLRQDQSWLVLGTNATSSLTTITGPQSYSGAVGVFSTASSGFANYFAGGNTTWVKRFNNSIVKVDFSASCSGDTTNNKAEFALQFLGATTPSAVGPAVFINPANTHTFGCNHILVGNIPAGTYTLRPLLRRASGAGNIVTDANDWLSYVAQEVI